MCCQEMLSCIVLCLEMLWSQIFKHLFKIKISVGITERIPSVSVATMLGILFERARCFRCPSANKFWAWQPRASLESMVRLTTMQIKKCAARVDETPELVQNQLRKVFGENGNWTPQRFPLVCCSRSIASNKLLKLPAPKPLKLCR
jgi:hypothetical protein